MVSAACVCRVRCAFNNSVVLTMLPRSARNREGSKEKKARWCMSGSTSSAGCMGVSSVTDGVVAIV